MTEESVKTLIRRRGFLKGKLTQFENFINEFSPEQSREQVALRLEKLEDTWSAFQETQEKIEIQDELTDHTNERIHFEEAYFLAVERARNLTISQEQTEQIQIRSNSAAMARLNVVKLPTLNLPKFSGKFEDWLEFSDTFNAIIDQNESILPVQKLHYLRSCLLGRAAETIQSLESSEQNYAIAWNLLKETYDNKRRIIQNHARLLFELPCVNKESAVELRALLDGTLKHVRALKALGEQTESWGILMLHLVTSKLDRNSLKEWEKSNNTQVVPSLEEFWKFLRQRCQILESINSDSASTSHNNNNKHSQGMRRVNSKAQQVYVGYQDQTHCPICKQQHNVQNCDKFKGATHSERADLIKKGGLCFNCLRSGHLVGACSASHCRICKKRHHTLLHKTEPQTQMVQNSVKEGGQPTTTLQACVMSQVLLTTAVVDIVDNTGKPYTCKILLDPGSQSNFMTTNLAHKLGLPFTDINIAVSGFNETVTYSRHSVTATINSRFKAYSVNLAFLVVPRITGLLPPQQVDRSHLAIPKNVKLADSEFHRPSEIEALVGAEVFYQLLCIGQIPLNDKAAVLQKTRFGWIVSGRVSNFNASRIRKAKCLLSTRDLGDRLQGFWELEEIPSTKFLSVEEAACEEHFNKNINRNKDGRYTVRLPFKENKVHLGESYQAAQKRVHGLERRLARNPTLKTQYQEFLQEYLELNHMREVKGITADSNSYYIPHHGIVKESSLTTKLRVVFDASAPTHTGVSLNDTLMVGPTIQPCIFSLLIRFRTHTIALIADIEKMYRQVNVHPDDTSYQRILWRNDSNEEMKVYELNTLTYGTACAPFLAIRTLHQLAQDEESSFPGASQTLQRDFYVDDVITGAETEQDAIRKRDELILLLQRGGFKLRKWSSNNAKVLESLPNESSDEHLCLNRSEAVKTLGVFWTPQGDSLGYSVKIQEQQRTTKRTILSQIAMLFDPLGLVTPVIVKTKILLQELWINNLTWDETVPLDVATTWNQLKKELPLLSQCNFPRTLIIPNATDIQLHGFCDASESAFGACFYIRSTNKQNHCRVRLVCGKSRVTPIKKQSLPRLELCAAYLLSRLYTTLQEAWQIKFNKICLWSDSTIVLHWINTAPHQLKTFVANRVARIQEATQVEWWKHVKSEENPADLTSRGCSPSILLTKTIWFNGPRWLELIEKDWPQHVPEIKDTIPELKTNVTLKVTVSYPILSRFSNLTMLKRVIAYCMRFINNCRSTVKSNGALTAQELNAAMERVICIVQKETFSTELKQLRAKEPLDRRSKIIALCPFVDNKGILRVGGRLSYANITYNQKHQILLPNKHHITELIIKYCHLKYLHAGPQGTLNAVRQEYWPIDGKCYTRKIIRSCMKCFRFNNNVPNYIMGNLPKSRVTAARPFVNVGVDFCGPFYIKEKRVRNRNKEKIYVAIFICLASKAVHLETVGDLTSEAFIAALKRFAARRGKPHILYSDNATNFTGANNELREIIQSLQGRSDNNTTQFLSNEGIKWSFSPPRSPHFGGIWEAAVRSFKHHMRRVVGETLLTLEQFNTYAIEIEAILNSRPLTPLSSDPNDLMALTPGHLLIGDSIKGIPELDLTNISANRLSMWQHIQKLKQTFWSRWYKEYLNELNQRTKWYLNSPEEIHIGKLVLIKDDNTPCFRWPLGRILETHPGEDGIVRVVTVKTATGVCKRSLKKIILVPITE